MLTRPRFNLDSPVTALNGVRDSDARRLAKLGIRTVRDLLLARPHEWDHFEPSPIAWLRAGQQAMVVGVVGNVQARQTSRQRLKLTEATLTDKSGAVSLVWFHQPYLAATLKRVHRLAVAGEVRSSRYGGLQMFNPRFEEVGADGAIRIGGLTPRYHLVEGLSSARVQQWVAEALALVDDFEETLPEDVRLRHGLLPIAEAVKLSHAPPALPDFRKAVQRFEFADVFELQAAFLWLRRRQSGEAATPIPYRQEVIDRFKGGLGFELTNAQRRATWEIFQDLEKEIPMNRLLNGDVGSGKTAVAAAAAAMAHAAGLQTVVMAPTEILARQHLHKFRAYLETSFPDLTVELLVSGQPAAERRRVLTAAASGHCAVLVGTHALIEEAVQLARLGLAVVDEQHRFGTRQRELLRAKAGDARPHFLAMTATPIPRSLALVLYGDLALSVIAELPPGRRPVTTEVVTPPERDRAYALVRREVQSGRQAFVICPLVEESEKLEVKAATAEFERLQKVVFPDLRLALVHGRLKEKDEVMAAFRNHDADVLVATPVIEVGVDVPNATVMLIEGAERFGLAQLHQFRGRVGRSDHQSYCLLLTDSEEQTVHRLDLMSQTNDGFRLAEADLRMRGAGELLGTRQHGDVDAAMAALQQPALIDAARAEAEMVLAEDPELARHPALRAAVERRLEQTSVS
ncbi:MAG TPA: ATP-dependent DNA helicase RecG [Candidatus Dormibacteraeota bacterium]